MGESMQELQDFDQTHQTLQEVSNALDSGMFVHVSSFITGHGTRGYCPFIRSFAQKKAVTYYGS